MTLTLRSVIRSFGHGVSLLILFSTTVFADAKTDGDRGIEELRLGNVVDAMLLLEKSAQGGYAPAQAALAFILDQSERNEEAFKWYREAAEQNNPEGLYGLGDMYAKGEGTEQNPEMAGQFIARAARFNHLLAMRVYATALERGSLGFEQDYAAAVEWFLNAANAGDQDSMRRLRDAYTEGQLGLPVDPEQAAKWDAIINPRKHGN